MAEPLFHIGAPVYHKDHPLPMIVVALRDLTDRPDWYYDVSDKAGTVLKNVPERYLKRMRLTRDKVKLHIERVLNNGKL